MGVPQSLQLCHNGFEIGNDATGEVDVIPIANSPAARQIAVMKKYWRRRHADSGPADDGSLRHNKLQLSVQVANTAMTTFL